jgi:ATP-dependent protease Clp ATPase subunit
MDVSRKAVRRGTGAHGLRTILEQLLLDLMFELPDRPEVRKIVIDEGSAETGEVRPLSGLAETHRPDPEQKSYERLARA